LTNRRKHLRGERKFHWTPRSFTGITIPADKGEKFSEKLYVQTKKGKDLFDFGGTKGKNPKKVEKKGNGEVLCGFWKNLGGNTDGGETPCVESCLLKTGEVLVGG